MRRIISIAAGTLLLSTASFAAGNVQVDIRGQYGDTLRSGGWTALQIWISNDMQMGGFQIPLTLSSPDEVTWAWNTQPAINAWGTKRYITHNPVSRIHPPAEHFDLTNGILVIEDYLPNQIFFGAGVMSGAGMAPGPLQWMLAVHLTAYQWSDGVHQLCVDMTQPVGYMEWAFSDLGGLSTNVTFLDPNGDGEWCFPVSMGFICGDVNFDGAINVGDAIYIANYVFRGGPPPLFYSGAGDVNRDSSINIGDAVYLVTYIYRGGPRPCNS